MPTPIILRHVFMMFDMFDDSSLKTSVFLVKTMPFIEATGSVFRVGQGLSRQGVV